MQGRRRVEGHLFLAGRSSDCSERLRWHPPCVEQGNRHLSTVSPSNSQSMEVVVVAGLGVDFVGPGCANFSFFAARV